MLVRTGIFSFFSLFIVVASVSAAAAQDSSIVGELERLRRDMNTLQSYLFREGKRLFFVLFRCWPPIHPKNVKRKPKGTQSAQTYD